MSETTEKQKGRIMPCKEITDEVYNYLILKKKEQTNVEDQAEGFDNAGGVQMSLVGEN